MPGTVVGRPTSREAYLADAGRGLNRVATLFSSMEVHNCLDDVRRIGDLESTAEAQEAATAVLAVLAERITDGEADDLARALPADLADVLEERDSAEAQSFGPEAFISRVGERTDVDEETARLYARAVFSAVNEVAPEGLTRAREQLPADYDRLFEFGTAIDAAEFHDVVDGTTGDVGTDPETLTTATLRTLGERLSAGEAEDLATYLPPGLRPALTEPASESQATFDVDEFLARVAERAGVDEPAAERGARAVLAVVADATGGHETKAARSQLPGAYDKLFERYGDR